MTNKKTITALQHKLRMQKKKEYIDKRIAAATEERGVIILLTGNGKGKTSSGFGTLVRCLGHGKRAGVVQFIKGDTQSGEQLFFANCPRVEFHSMQTGFTWETQDKDVDMQAAQLAWHQAAALLEQESIDLVLLDELTYVIKYGYLAVSTVITALQTRPRMQHVIITGRNAPKEIIAVADTVSDIRAEKHAFNNGIKAQKGVEW